MARMHTRKKGKAGSDRSRYTVKPTWVKMTEDEITDVIVQSKKSGMTSAEIGIKLRDQYAVPSTKVILGKKIGTIVKEKGVSTEIPDDLNSLIKKYKRASSHMQLNPRDKSNKRGTSLIMAKILRLVKYYKSNNILPDRWNLDKVL